MIERVGEVAWVLDYLDDLDSDFSRFHRVDDFRAMPAPRLFALARRLPVYGGALAVALQQETPEPDPVPTTLGAEEVSSDLHTLTTHPGLSGLIEIG